MLNEKQTPTTFDIFCQFHMKDITELLYVQLTSCCIRDFRDSITRRDVPAGACKGDDTLSSLCHPSSDTVSSNPLLGDCSSSSSLHVTQKLA